MSSLAVTYADGRKETLELSRTAPLSIGSQSFNDLCITDPDVAAMHCRIGWSKSGFEVTAATNRGVELNGHQVQHAQLKPGDVLRLGSCDIVYREADHAEPAPEKRDKSPKSPKAKQDERKPDQAPTGRTEPRREPEPPEPFDLAESVVSEELQEFGAERKGSSHQKERPPAGVGAEIRRELQGGRRRPGEQEILKSPLILSLMGGSLVLLLIAGSLWFLLGRETATKLYQLGEQHLAQARYSQAIEVFEEYLVKYPRSTQATVARVQIGKARVQRELAGATPAWTAAGERLQGFVQEFRNTAGYRDLLPTVRGFAEEIALGATRAAEQTRDPSLLPVAAQATLLLERSAGDDEKLEGLLARIQQATQKAEAAIARQQRRDLAVSTMEVALAANHPIDALTERDKLLRTFPEYRTDRDVARILQQALEREISTVTVTELDEPALQPPPNAPATKEVLPVQHARSRTSDSSLGQTVWLWAQDACYAIDTVTGVVVWRVPIGVDPAFAPRETTGSAAGWLMSDRRTNTLFHCRRDNGQMLWRQALTAVPQGAPLVDEGQVYQVTADQQLTRMDLETGRISARLSFSQPVAGPPVVDPSGQFLFLTGERGVIYTLRKRPLECVAVTFTDHAAGSVRAPLVLAGRLLLLSENDRVQSSRLRLWNVAEPTEPLTKEVEQRVSGPVFDAPVLRGPHLVVPLQGERLAAFVINDAEGRAEMSLVGTYRVQDGYRGPMHVIQGPDQQFWLSSTALRRFEILSDSIRINPNFVAVGMTSQPLQLVGETLFVGRRARFAEGVQFTDIDRNTLSGSWQTLIGARPLVVTAGNAGNLIGATESGTVFSIGRSRLAAGGVESAGVIDLELPTSLTTAPLVGKLADGRLTVSSGGTTPRLWLVDGAGRIGSPVDLSAALEQPPVQLAGGLLLPLPGRLQFRRGAGGPAVEDWRAPVADGPPAAWRHLVATEEDEVLAIDAAGKCRRIQLRTGEIPHLAETAAVTLEGLSNIPPVRLPDSLVVAQQQGKLQRINTRTLEPLASWQSAGELRGMALAGAHLLAWDAEALTLLNPAENLRVVWSQPLQGKSPVGEPILRDDQLWIACRDGEILRAGLSDGKQTVVAEFGCQLTYGLVAVDQELWAVACDGTLLSVPTGGGVSP